MSSSIIEAPVTTTKSEPVAVPAGTKSEATRPTAGPSKPLPVWFFAFEGVMAAAFDLSKAWQGAWLVVAVLGMVNMVIGLTVLRSRAKLVRAMLKNAGTRKIAFGLIALRVLVHLLLSAAGSPITSVAGHLALGVVMGAVTMTLMWFNQRVAFRALGLAGGDR